MENEIDLKEILQVLWRGKYFILAVTALFTLGAVLYTSFLITPVYEYSANLYLGPLQVKSKEAIAIIEQEHTVGGSVKGMAEDQDLLERSIDVTSLPDSESVLQIRVEHADPAVCVSLVERTGQAIIKAVSDYRFGEMSMEKERDERLLSYLEETAAEYLVSRDEQITDLLEEDPVYKIILEEKAACMLRVKLLDFDIGEISENLSSDADAWLKGKKEAAWPVSVNKKFYPAAAFLLGLLLSVSIIFLRHYFTVHVASGTGTE